MVSAIICCGSCFHVRVNGSSSLMGGLRCCAIWHRVAFLYLLRRERESSLRKRVSFKLSNTYIATCHFGSIFSETYIVHAEGHVLFLPFLITENPFVYYTRNIAKHIVCSPDAVFQCSLATHAELSFRGPNLRCESGTLAVVGGNCDRAQRVVQIGVGGA